MTVGIGDQLSCNRQSGTQAPNNPKQLTDRHRPHRPTRSLSLSCKITGIRMKVTSKNTRWFSASSPRKTNSTKLCSMRPKHSPRQPTANANDPIQIHGHFACSKPAALLHGWCLASPQRRNPLRQVRGDVVMQHGSGMYMDDIWKDADCRGDWRKAMEQLAEHLTNLFGSPITLQVVRFGCAFY